MTEQAPKPAKSGFAADCPCVQLPCPIHGDCLACVSAHRKHGLHLPECLQPIMRGLVEQLAVKVEYKVTDTRPGPDYWKNQKAAK